MSFTHKLNIQLLGKYYAANITCAYWFMLSIKLNKLHMRKRWHWNVKESWLEKYEPTKKQKAKAAAAELQKCEACESKAGIEEAFLHKHKPSKIAFYYYRHFKQVAADILIELSLCRLFYVTLKCDLGIKNPSQIEF